MLPGLAATSAGRQPCPRDYQLRRTLGEGSFGIVKLALHVPSGTEVAVKIIQKKEQSAATAKRLLCETQGLARLRHPHILRLVEVMESEETVFIISEYVRGGNLLDHLMEHGPLTEEEARGWFRQLVSALQYCHRRGVIHRDLKPENVLLDPAGSAKLADFGFCSLDPGGPLSTFCGTPGYMAPEVMQLQPYDGRPLVLSSHTAHPHSLPKTPLVLKQAGLKLSLPADVRRFSSPDSGIELGTDGCLLK
uniref:non-specific serine/threonine protein kinase n=1 Tax=Equus caballus TaxID=9796 RepID=A0A3Q2IBF2_HORSE